MEGVLAGMRCERKRLRTRRPASAGRDARTHGIIRAICARRSQRSGHSGFRVAKAFRIASRQYGHQATGQQAENTSTAATVGGHDSGADAHAAGDGMALAGSSKHMHLHHAQVVVRADERQHHRETGQHQVGRHTVATSACRMASLA